MTFLYPSNCLQIKALWQSDKNVSPKILDLQNCKSLILGFTKLSDQILSSFRVLMGNFTDLQNCKSAIGAYKIVSEDFLKELNFKY